MRRTPSQAECIFTPKGFAIGRRGDKFARAAVFTKLTLPPIHLRETCLMLTHPLHGINN